MEKDASAKKRRLAAALTAPACLAAALLSCSESGVPGNPWPPAVYVAGYQRDEGASGARRAALWKDGEAQRLDAGGPQSEAFSVYVYGSNVYVAGQDGGRAVVWKNGAVFYDLGGDLGGVSASSVFVHGGSVYVAGSRSDGGGGVRAALWKDGEAQRLDASGPQSGAFSVFVSSRNVCAAGYDVVDGQSRAVLWKDGAAEMLADGASEARSVYDMGGYQCVAGIEYPGSLPCATYWSISSAWRLGYAGSRAFSVFAHGSVVYVAGQDEGRAVVWQDNGHARGLDAGSNSYARSVYVHGSSVYAAGQDGGRAAVWKNGGVQRMGGYDGAAHSVFVK